MLQLLSGLIHAGPFLDPCMMLAELDWAASFALGA